MLIISFCFVYISNMDRKTGNKRLKIGFYVYSNRNYYAIDMVNISFYADFNFKSKKKKPIDRIYKLSIWRKYNDN